MYQTLDAFISDCPACRQPMRVKETTTEDSIIREERCSTCDHYDKLDFISDEGRENACDS